MVPREDHRLRPGPNPELVEQIRDVVADGLLADREALADVGVGEALANQRQDLALAGREAGEGGVLSATRRGRETHEVEDDLLKARPGRLVLEENVVAGVQLDELRTRDSGGQAARFRDRADLVVAGVDDERRRLDRAEQAGNVDRRASLEQPRRHFTGAGPTAELVEPADLRCTAAGDEAGREDLAEHRILLAPADPHQLQHGAVLALALRIAALRPSTGVATVENHP